MHARKKNWLRRRVLGIPLALAAAVMAALAVTGGALAAAAATGSSVPVYNVSVGSSAGGVAGYYGADDGHTHWRYVQAVVTVSQSLVNLNGSNTSSPKAGEGAELCDENFDNGLGDAAQIGVFWNPDGGPSGTGDYEVRYGFGDFSPAPSPIDVWDDPCIQGGVIAAGLNDRLLANTVLHVGDKILVSVYYDPAASGHGEHEIQFSATDESQLNEHRSAVLAERAQSFTEYGIGVVSAPGVTLTAPALNLVGLIGHAAVNFYSSDKPAFPVTSGKPYYGYGGLTEVQYVNGSGQTLMSPNGSLSVTDGDASFSVYEGSTTG